MRKIAGFHLMELMIVLAIISILSMFAIPIYTQYLVKERRLEAAQLLSKISIAAEQYHLEQGSYQAMTLAALHADEYAVKDNYQFILELQSDVDYVLIAKPIHAQADDDRYCGSLSLDSSGKRGVSGVGGIDGCW